MEGILRRALVVSLYCNLSPHQMFLHLNTVMFIPKSPRKRIKWSQHVYVHQGWQKWRQKWQEHWGWEGEEGQKQWTEGGVGHMCMPADDSGLTCRSKGRTGGRKGVDNSHKSCNVWYFEFSSVPGSARLEWFIVSFHFTQNFSFKFSFDSVLTFGATGEDAF